MLTPCIFFRNRGGLEKVNIDEIVLIEAKKNCIKFWLPEKDYVVRSTLQAALSRLPEKQFLRVHRSWVVSVNYIGKIGRESLFLTDFETEIPVSRQYYPEIVKQIFILDTEMPNKKKSEFTENDPLSLKLRKLIPLTK
ncbi:MAG TPA: LytTR family DNA-binding domain-containing protein [Puia sp.]|jgi:DNA-binding LytR/AlgR family response regulator